MRLIGILGGVASGKSLVARQLAGLGAGLLDADRAAHEVLRTAEVEAAARKRWGEEIFGPDGRIDRPRLAKIVFADAPQAEGDRTYLEQLIHPEVEKRLARQAEQMAAAGRPAAVLDAPLLAEAGWDKLCDRLWFVDAPRPLRLARALERGWSEKDFDARESAQQSLERKRRRADAVVDNSASPEETREQVRHLWHELTG
jgi:dephospho-CoA kinase